MNWKLGQLISALVIFSFPALGAGNVDYVNPFIGTADVLSGAYGADTGGTMPLVQPPFAMTSWTPQTRHNRVGATSYNYSDTNLFGFMGTHQPAIWMGDFGYVTLMPGVDLIKTTEAERKLGFSHAEETSTPYVYSVVMDAGGSRTIKGEMTATEHCAIMRFTYPRNTNSSIVMEATRAAVTGKVAVNPGAREITGYNPDRMDARLTTLQLPNFKGYFVIHINKSFAGFGTYRGTNLNPNATNITAENVGAYATFSTRSDEPILVKVGMSFISVDQARANLNAEIPGWNFGSVQEKLRKDWNQKLNAVSISGGSKSQKTQFYTAMYHALLYPRVFSEQGRYYSAFDDKVHSGVAYTAFSLWDTFRAQNSFLTIFCPERINDMVQALLNDYREGGWMPKWPNPSYTGIMISTHADSVVAEAINKGFNGFDYHLAYAAVYQDAMTPPNNDQSKRWEDRQTGEPYSAREGLTLYKQLGYVPHDKTGRSASCTLEGAYDDWCVAQVAKAVGKTNDYDYFMNRSLNYRNVFNPAHGAMEARNSDGSWAGGEVTGFSEGGQKMYQFCVMHDVPGLITLMGGTTNFNASLDQKATDLNALVNNEPGNHYPYLYDFSGQPYRCQSLVRAALTNFTDLPNGLPGNDDCGQTSAWLMFACMGFYPVNPASGIYMIGSPVFSRMTLHLQNGHRFEILAANNSSTNKYVQSASLNGFPLGVPFITYSQIMAGGSLSFVMGPSPSSWASNWRGVPLPSK